MFSLLTVLKAPESLYTHINLSNANAASYPGPGCVLSLNTSKASARDADCLLIRLLPVVPNASGCCVDTSPPPQATCSLAT